MDRKMERKGKRIPRSRMAAGKTGFCPSPSEASRCAGVRNKNMRPKKKPPATPKGDEGRLRPLVVYIRVQVLPDSKGVQCSD